MLKHKFKKANRVPQYFVNELTITLMEQDLYK